MNLKQVEKEGKQLIIDKDDVDLSKILKYLGIGFSLVALLFLNPILLIIEDGYQILFDDFGHTMFFTDFWIIFLGIGLYTFGDKFVSNSNPIVSYSKSLRTIDFGNKSIQIKKGDTFVIEERSSTSDSATHNWKIYLTHRNEKYFLNSISGFKSDRDKLTQIFNIITDDLMIPFSIVSPEKKSVVVGWDVTQEHKGQMELDSTKLLTLDLETEQVRIHVNQNITLTTQPDPKVLSMTIILVGWLNLYFMSASMIAMLGPGLLQVFGFDNPFPILIIIEIGLIPVTIFLTFLVVRFFKANRLTVVVTNDSITIQYHSRWIKNITFTKNQINEISKILKENSYTIILKGKNVDYSLNINQDDKPNDFSFYIYLRNAIHTKWIVET